MKTKYPWFKNGLFSIMWSSQWRGNINLNQSRLVWGTRIKYGIAILPRDVWIHVWLPKWCKGRGYYISVGMWLFAVYRGY